MNSSDEKEDWVTVAAETDPLGVVALVGLFVALPLRALRRLVRRLRGRDPGRS